MHTCDPSVALLRRRRILRSAWKFPATSPRRCKHGILGQHPVGEQYHRAGTLTLTLTLIRTLTRSPNPSPLPKPNPKPNLNPHPHLNTNPNPNPSPNPNLRPNPNPHPNPHPDVGSASHAGSLNLRTALVLLRHHDRPNHFSSVIAKGRTPAPNPDPSPMTPKPNPVTPKPYPYDP